MKTDRSKVTENLSYRQNQQDSDLRSDIFDHSVKKVKKEMKKNIM